MDKVRIMVIDDEVTVTTVLNRIFTGAGYDVTVANDGATAVSLLSTMIPDLILLDIKMPGMDGYKTLEHIRLIDENIPVIMLTANPDASDVNKSINLGADDYIRKPFRTQELLARIKVKLKRTGKN